MKGVADGPCTVHDRVTEEGLFQILGPNGSVVGFTLTRYWAIRLAAANDLLTAAEQASQFIAKLSADGNVFAKRMLRQMEAAIAKAEGTRT